MQPNKYLYSNRNNTIAIRTNGVLNAVATDRLGSTVVEYNPLASRWDHFAHGQKIFGKQIYKERPYPKDNQWDDIGVRLSQGAEVMGNSQQHWVNITGIRTADKLRLFGGGTRRVLIGTSVWDPISGHTTDGPTGFSIVRWIKFN